MMHVPFHVGISSREALESVQKKPSIRQRSFGEFMYDTRALDPIVWYGMYNLSGN